MGARVLRIIYSKYNYNIYREKDCFIVHNIKKEFSDGHTHVQSFKIAKHLIDLAHFKSIPHHLSRYLLISLARISDNEAYQESVMELADNKKKKQIYYNVNKGGVKK